jgi:integrase
MAITLTDAFIKSCEIPSRGKRLIFDNHPDAPQGFGLRVSAGGQKSFVLRYKLNGKDRLLTIGEYGKNAWRLPAARIEAGRYRQEVDRKKDILAERRRERDAETVAEAVEAYCTQHADKLRSGKAVRSSLERYLVPKLGDTKLAKVRRRDIITLVEAIAAEHGRAAALLLTYIKQVFAFAEDREWIEANPTATIRPRKVSRNMQARNRERVLTDAEIKAFWDRVEGCGMHRLSAIALKLILVTGQRPGEVAGMRWDEVSSTDWIIPASRRGKTGTAHTVQLTGTALALLEEAKAEAVRLDKRRKRKPAGFVFEARPGTPVTTAGLGRAVGRYAPALGNLDADTWGTWSPHDLRRTCRTRLAAAGIGDTVAEAVIGHTRKGIAAVYDRHKYEIEKRHALETWEWRLLGIVKGEVDNVLPMRRNG